MNEFKRHLDFTIKELEYVFPEVSHISHMASTREHLYFITYGSKYEFDFSIRVDRNSGKVEVTENSFDSFAWGATGVWIPLNVGGLK